MFNQQLLMSGEGGAPPDILLTATDSLSTTSKSYTYTISNADLGDASSDRWIAVAYAVRGDSNATVVSDVTVGGVSFDYRIEKSATGNSNNAGICLFQITSGTTADVVLTCITDDAQGMVMQVFHYRSSYSTTLEDTDNTYASGVGLDISTREGGGIIVATLDGNGSDGSWDSPFTTLFSFDTESNDYATIGYTPDAFTSTGSLTAEFSPAPSGISMVAVSLRYD